MATKIEWTDETWNPIRFKNKKTGKVGHMCEKISAGCKNCYAERFQPRLQGEKVAYGPQSLEKGELFLDEHELLKPLSWKKPRMIFPFSMTDLFWERVPFEWVDKIFAVMALTPEHTYQVLTKRADRMEKYFADSNGWSRMAFVRMAVYSILGYDGRFEPSKGLAQYPFKWPLKNVWLIVSVENQEQLDKRVPHLLRCPAAVRGLSCEPLLGPISLQWNYGYGPDGKPYGESCIKFLHWVIAGGESGPAARPMHPDWVRSLRDQCQAAYVPFFFKQWGEWANGYDVEANGTDWNGMWELDPQDGGAQRFYWPDSEFRKLDEYKGLAPGGVGGDTFVLKVGKKAAGRLLDGVEWNQFPETGGNEGEK